MPLTTCTHTVWPLFGHGPGAVCGAPLRTAFPGASNAYATCTRHGHVNPITGQES